MLNKIMESCRFLLNNFQGAQDCKYYLNSRLSTESQEIFGFGYFPDIKDISVLFALVGEDILRECKLYYSLEIEDSWSPRSIPKCYFENYPLVMPFRDAYGNVVALVGRTILPEEEYKKLKISKYKNTIFKKGNYVFGLYENKKSILEQDSVYVVEGQLDVIKANEKGLKNVVGLGSAHMTAYQFSVITRYTNNIFLLLDNDEAGENGRKAIINKYGNFANIRNFYVPEGYKDIDEYISKEGISKSEDISFVIKY